MLLWFLIKGHSNEAMLLFYLEKENVPSLQPFQLSVGSQVLPTDTY